MLTRPLCQIMEDGYACISATSAANLSKKKRNPKIALNPPKEEGGGDIFRTQAVTTARELVTASQTHIQPVKFTRRFGATQDFSFDRSILR